MAQNKYNGPKMTLMAQNKYNDPKVSIMTNKFLYWYKNHYNDTNMLIF